MISKKAIILLALSSGMIFAETFGSYRDDNDITRRNLRVIPRTVSDEELVKIMREVSKSLGVKCSYCHIDKPGEKTAEGRQAHDWASDDKEMKVIARKMMRMTKDINEKLQDIGDKQFERINCITCHQGHTSPSMSLDSIGRSFLK